MRLPDRSGRPQSGVALVAVLALLMLCGLAVLGACRVMLLNEALAGNAADYGNAFSAAEALLRDAETDVLGLLPDGSACRPVAAAAGCRPAGSAVAFPFAAGDMDRLTDTLRADPVLPCRDGICVAPATAPLPDIETNIALFTDHGRSPKAYAEYGQFTGAVNAGPRRNPYLERNAWYWVEVIDYQVGSGIASGNDGRQPDPDRPYVFRITALVLGNRPGTRVMLREVFIPSPLAPHR